MRDRGEIVKKMSRNKEKKKRDRERGERKIFSLKRKKEKERELIETRGNGRHGRKK